MVGAQRTVGCSDVEARGIISELQGVDKKRRMVDVTLIKNTYLDPLTKDSTNSKTLRETGEGTRRATDGAHRRRIAAAVRIARTARLHNHSTPPHQQDDLTASSAAPIDAGPNPAPLPPSRLLSSSSRLAKSTVRVDASPTPTTPSGCGKARRAPPPGVTSSAFSRDALPSPSTGHPSLTKLRRLSRVSRESGRDKLEATQHRFTTSRKGPRTSTSQSPARTSARAPIRYPARADFHHLDVVSLASRERRTTKRKRNVDAPPPAPALAQQEGRNSKSPKWVSKKGNPISFLTSRDRQRFSVGITTHIERTGEETGLRACLEKYSGLPSATVSLSALPSDALHRIAPHRRILALVERRLAAVTTPAPARARRTGVSSSSETEIRRASQEEREAWESRNPLGNEYRESGDSHPRRPMLWHPHLAPAIRVLSRARMESAYLLVAL
ncbi:hypothetical protein DFH06DRAFT_1129712 [Mycena polygramma]|nr:hypothetical protein DFH06DRAFT_1129712 [Mycena polygramma]